MHPPGCGRRRGSVVRGLAAGWLGCTLVGSFAGCALTNTALVAEPSTVHLGVVPTGQAAVAQFTLINRGPKAIGIKSVTTSCTCTVTELSTRELAPRQQGRLQARFVAGDVAGEQTADVRVSVRGQAEPLLLRLAATVDPLVVAEPAVIDFGRVGTGSVARSVTVRGTREEPVEIVGWRLPTAAQHVLDVHAAANRPANVQVALRQPVIGQLNQTLIIETNRPERPLLAIPVRAEVVNPWRTSSDAFVLGFVEDGAVATATLTIHEPTLPAIRKAWTDLPGATVRTTRHSSGLEVTLAWRPRPGVLDSARWHVAVAVDDLEATVVRFPILGTVLPPVETDCDCG